MYAKTIQTFEGRSKETAITAPILNIGENLPPGLLTNVLEGQLRNTENKVKLVKRAVVSYSADPKIIPDGSESKVWIMKWLCRSATDPRASEERNNVVASVLTSVRRISDAGLGFEVQPLQEAGSAAVRRNLQLFDGLLNQKDQSDILLMPKPQAEKLEIEDSSTVLLLREPLGFSDAESERVQFPALIL